jgi:hypothetical protein
MRMPQGRARGKSETRKEIQMKATRSWRTFALCAVPFLSVGALLASSRPALAAGPPPPPLTNEFLTTFGPTVTANCDPSGISTISFVATGSAFGPYTGTFGESGTATIGPPFGPFAPGPLLSFHADFLINSPSGSVSGSKDLGAGPTGPTIGACTSSPDGTMVFRDIFYNPPGVTYHVSITTPNGTFPDQGTAFGLVSDDEICPGGPLGCMPTNNSFFEGFMSNQVPTTDPAVSASGDNVIATEGTASNGTVAMFTDPDPTSTASEYTTTIDWGDGQSSAGTVSGPTGGPFTVSGSHVYAEEGSDTVKVTITDTDNASNSATATSSASVQDASLSSQCATPAVMPQTYSGPTAKFTDQSSTGTPNDFSATINWGDGSGASSGSIVGGPGNSPYTVNGSHTYTSTGYFTVKTTVNDVGGRMTTATCANVLVFAGAPGGGSFAIGDLENQSGRPVTFWGAQWWQDNATSAGTVASSFKGFAQAPSNPTCGDVWMADPGNSTPPPPGPLPAFMSLIVTSSYSQSGPTISGNVEHIVVVRTNPGYQPDPGHPGTGTVVTQIC